MAALSTALAPEPILINHPDHKITGRILGAPSSTALLTIFASEEERFGWYTAVKLLNTSAKRGHKVDQSDERLHRLLDLL